MKLWGHSQGRAVGSGTQPYRKAPMPYPLDQLLPSAQSFSLWIYWILGAFALLEAVVLTSIIIPGTLAVIVGGMLVQRGIIGFVDLFWFVAIGAIIGGEVSFRIGRLTSSGLSGMSAFRNSHYAQRATASLQRFHGPALAFGRFTGPHAAFMPFAAGMSQMPHRGFMIWNLLGAIPYALAFPAFGYLAGRIIATLGAAAPRPVAFAVMAIAVLGFLWLIVIRSRNALPLLAQIASSLGSWISQNRLLRAFVRRHPALARFLAARFGTERFLGLTLTVLTALLIYVMAAWADSVFDFLGAQSGISSDTRIANILYSMRDPQLVAFFGWVTQIGGRHGVITMLVGISAALLILRRYDLLAGLWIAAVGNQLTVTLLKAIFARPRSELGYYVETSGSFPSGHAAAAVAVWAMLFYLFWRLRALPAIIAGFGAVTMVFLIGLSRVYLVEHYLSDVINGYLVGAVWLVLGVAFCEWRRAGRLPPAAQYRWAATGSILTAIAVTGYLAVATANPLNTAPEPALQVTNQPDELLNDAPFPTTTETLTGEARQSLNLIVTAEDAAALKTAMQGAGWLDAPRPDLFTLAGAFVANWTGRPLPSPLVIPTFWGERPNLLAFALPNDAPDSTRLHARFWDSRYRSKDGQIVFIGTLTPEDPLDWAVSDDATAAPDAEEALHQFAAKLRGTGLDPVIQP